MGLGKFAASLEVFRRMGSFEKGLVLEIKSSDEKEIKNIQRCASDVLGLGYTTEIEQKGQNYSMKIKYQGNKNA